MNLSPVHFRSRELIETVRSTLAETGLAPDRLELEITESVLIKDTEAALDILKALKKIGVNIAMDDFGTGYSSLAYLNSFPFDKLKIDRSFIASLEDDEKSRAIVRSVLSLGESLAMTVTAEGVETAQQAEFLMREGCEQIQGYLLRQADARRGDDRLLNELEGPRGPRIVRRRSVTPAHLQEHAHDDGPSRPCRIGSPESTPLRYQGRQPAAPREAERRIEPFALERFPDAEALIAACAPSEPVFCFKPDALRAAAQRFAAFPGRVLYAVKCNPHPFVLQTLYDEGITDFDVASQNEIELVGGLFGKAAGQFFNNPAKTRPAIRIGEPGPRHPLLHRGLHRRSGEDPRGGLPR